MAKTVFLSSVRHGLEEYRKEGHDAITEARFAITAMEAFDAVDLPPEVNDSRLVVRCDIFVLLMGNEYGTLSLDGKRSYTELEFRTALAEKKQILAFYVEDAAGFKPVPEQVAFFRSVRIGRTPLPVKSPADFKYKLRVALDGLLPDAVPISKPKINRMLAKICDRSNQLDDFSLALNAPERYVHIHVLYGNEQQQHHSCVERLICRKILKQRPESEINPIAPPRGEDRVIAWPAGTDPPVVVLRRLRQALSLAIKPEYYFRPSDDAGKFVEVAASAAAAYLVFRHPLSAPALTGIRDPLALYLEFWKQVADVIKARTSLNRFQIVVFFEIAAADPAAVRPQLDSLFNPSADEDEYPCVRTILPELTDVNRDRDIQAWWTAYHNYVRPQFLALGLTANFPDSAMPMLAVETKIKEIVGLEKEP